MERSGPTITDSFTITGLCVNCGKLVEIHQSTNSDTQETNLVAIHDGCNRPTLSMWTDNPRKLGVVTRIAD